MTNLKFSFLFILTSFLNISVFAQLGPESIDIVRDLYGVPHIFAKTDAEVAYGLAWAHAEDDFKTTQLAYLAGNNLLNNYLGKKGVPADFLTQFIGSKEIVDRNYTRNLKQKKCR